MTKARLLIFVMAAMALLTAYARPVPTVDNTAVRDHHTSPEYNYFYLEALRLQNKGDFAAAFDLLRHCVDLDSLAPEAHYLLGAYYADLKMDSLASVSLKKAVELNPKNEAYHEGLAQWHLRTEEYGKAIEAYEHLYANNKSRTDVLELLLRLYEQEKNYNKMLSTIERYEQVEGLSEEITLSKMQVYQMKGDKKNAYKALKKLSDEHPNDVNYKLMLGNWLQQNDRIDEAREIFMQAQKDEPGNEYVAASLYDFYRLQGEDSLATVYRDKILLNKHTASTTKMTMLQNVIRDNEKQGGDSTEVLQLFRDIMNADPKNVDIASLNAAYMQLKGMPGDSVNSALRHVLAIAPDHAVSRLQLLQSEWRTQNWDSIISICKPALEYNPEEMAFCYYLGLAYYQKKDSKSALDAFRRGVTRINDKSDKEMVSDFYALMGDIQHEMGMKQEAYIAYDSCLQWKPDNIACLNNYAYFLSIEGGDLKKAEGMSLKTINAEPNNATYLDTYAWILFLQERYSEAKVFIDRTIESADSTENNSTLYDHAGDIYEACGDTKRAVELWQQAIKEGSETEAVIRKKIKKYAK